MSLIGMKPILFWTPPPNKPTDYLLIKAGIDRTGIDKECKTLFSY